MPQFNHIRRPPLWIAFLIAGCSGASGEGAAGTLEVDLGASAPKADAITVGTDAGATDSSNDSAGTRGGDTGVGGDTDGINFDVGVPDLPSCSSGQGGALEFSYIWVANSAQGTVSKIDTQTLTELGRYIVRPDSAGSPSRTSVNLSGDVAVANRAGGLTKIYARTEDCVERNGIPGIQTSSGAADILPWGQEECIAWYTESPYNAQRPVAWTSGRWDDQACAWVEQAVWTTVSNLHVNGSVHVARVNGDTGMPEVVLPVPELVVGDYGPYGGAVDPNGDFWFHSRDAPFVLVHVDADGGAYEILPVPAPVNPYGITVDSRGRIWLAGVEGGTVRYDPAAAAWSPVVPQTGLGIQEDAEGVMWMAVYPWNTVRGVHALDVDTMAHLGTINMAADAPSSRGVSIDFDGYVWMVDEHSSAWKIDPDAGTWRRYPGLTGPYTYSDMTGWGLTLVTPG